MALAPAQALRVEDVCGAHRDRDEARFWAKVDRSGDCWLWTASKMKTGYGRFGMGSDKVWQAHRFSALLAWGEIPAGALVLHHCDTPSCVRPEHLYAGDNAANNADMVARERFNLPLLRGNRNSQTKLTEDDVREIRRRAAAGETKTSLGLAFGVSRQTASDIVHRKFWEWVE